MAMSMSMRMYVSIYVIKPKPGIPGVGTPISTMAETLPIRVKDRCCII